MVAAFCSMATAMAFVLLSGILFAKKWVLIPIILLLVTLALVGFSGIMILEHTPSGRPSVSMIKPGTHFGINLGDYAEQNGQEFNYILVLEEDAILPPPIIRPKDQQPSIYSENFRLYRLPSKTFSNMNRIEFNSIADSARIFEVSPQQTKIIPSEIRFQ